MSGPIPEGDEHSLLRPVSSMPASETAHVDVWVAVLEFVQSDPGRPFLIDDVQAVIGHLREWYPSGLWCSDRYAIQLQIPAHSAHQAVTWASAYHREAAHAAGMPDCPLARVEVFTLEELERSWEDFQPTDPIPALAPEGLLCDAVYTATRGLLAAATQEELVDAVIDFVTEVGGRVELGAPQHLAGTIDVDVSIEGDQTLHATADAMSVAGLIIEHSLPALLADARLALNRLRSVISKG